MFTGLVEIKGKVISNSKRGYSNRLVVAASFDQVGIGESIAVNGVCLTVLPADTEGLHFDLSPETLNLTNLANVACGDFVNLERAMQASTRFGGHYVLGHIDKMACVKSICSIGECIEVELAHFNAHDLLYLIPKGSITVQGVSLTINKVSNNSVKLMLVPHTLLHTTLESLEVGQNVNIEFDYFTRIVAHQLHISGKLNYEAAL